MKQNTLQLNEDLIEACNNSTAVLGYVLGYFLGYVPGYEEFNSVLG